MKLFKSYIQQPADISRKWVVIDASSAPLGRMSTLAAKYLIGKYKPTYTPHVDNGDYVIVINAGKLVVTGDKEKNKMYYSYSGFPGGLKELSLKEVKEKSPEKIIIKAVEGMIPRNKLASERMARLKVYTGEEHAHMAQKPVKVEVK